MSVSICPTCGNTGPVFSYVRRCKCGRIYCDRCGSHECPACGRSYLESTTIGQVGG